MSLDAVMVRRIAKLARIRIEDEEIARLQGELNAILGYVEQLEGVDVAGVAPLSGGAQMALRLRDDVIDDGDLVTKILVNAPERGPDTARGPYFSVPKVVE